MAPFWLGLAAGILIAIPLVAAMAMLRAKRMRELSERARASERLAELGTMTGGLAHEIKNPLSSVNLNIQLLREDLQDVERNLPEDDNNAEHLRRMTRRFDSLAREVQRLRDILDDFLKFAGRIRLDRTDVDVNELIAELVDFFTPQAQTGGVQLRTQPGGDEIKVAADRGLLKQAILNLAINATQAMTDARDEGHDSGGNSELIFRSERKRQSGNDEIHIHVTDTGPGINQEDLTRIFHPYYSSKKGGTGLGLPTSRRIAEEHGGSLTVHSEPGRGSDFIIAIPANESTKETDS